MCREKAKKKEKWEGRVSEEENHFGMDFIATMALELKLLCFLLWMFSFHLYCYSGTENEGRGLSIACKLHAVCVFRINA